MPFHGSADISNFQVHQLRDEEIGMLRFNAMWL